MDRTGPSQSAQVRCLREVSILAVASLRGKGVRLKQMHRQPRSQFPQAIEATPTGTPSPKVARATRNARAESAMGRTMAPGGAATRGSQVQTASAFPIRGTAMAAKRRKVNA